MPQTSNATIDGRVTNGGRTAGQSGAAVTLTAVPESITHLSQAAIGRTTSRSDGSFHFDTLPAGRFYITASKAGYLEGAFGRLVPSGTQAVLNLAAGAHVSDISIPLWKPSTISGSLLDDQGLAVARNPIQLLQEGYAGGRRLLHARTIVRSDGTGSFRFDGLVPGTYFLAALASHVTVPVAAIDPPTDPADLSLWQARLRLVIPPTTPGMSSLPAAQFGNFKVQPTQSSQPDPKLRTVFPLTFFPSSQSLSGALPIDLAAEEDRQNADVTVARVPAVAIRGSVTGPSGPVSAAVVRLMPDGLEPVRLTTGFEAASGIADAEGSFVMFGVPAGEYTIEAMDWATSSARCRVHRCGDRPLLLSDMKISRTSRYSFEMPGD